MAVYEAGKLADDPKRGFQHAGDGVYGRNHFFIVTPHTNGLVDFRVFRSWENMRRPPNVRFNAIDVKGMEVGAAYDDLFHRALSHPFNVAWVLTLETDNIVPEDAMIKLLKAASACPDCGAHVDPYALNCPEGHKAYDAVAGLYFTKDELFPMPMAFGKPDDSPGENYYAIDVEEHIKAGAVVEVRGVAMGCTLFRAETMRKLERPYFKTEQGATQDLNWCRRASQELGARFAVHCGVGVGHLDYETGEMF